MKKLGYLFVFIGGFIGINLSAQIPDEAQLILSSNKQIQLGLDDNDNIVFKQKDSVIDPGEKFGLNMERMGYANGNPDRHYLYTISTTNKAGEKVYLTFSESGFSLSKTINELEAYWIIGDGRIRSRQIIQGYLGPQNVSTMLGPVTILYPDSDTPDVFFDFKKI